MYIQMYNCILKSNFKRYSYALVGSKFQISDEALILKKYTFLRDPKWSANINIYPKIIIIILQISNKNIYTYDCHVCAFNRLL